MALVGCEEQSAALAERTKGELTVELFAGLATLTEAEVLAAAVTLMATSVSQAAPWLPQALTCKVCAPVAAVMETLTDLLSTMVVLLLLSRE